LAGPVVAELEHRAATTGYAAFRGFERAGYRSSCFKKALGFCRLLLIHCTFRNNLEL
jgi:hypothetical protein